MTLALAVANRVNVLGSGRAVFEGDSAEVAADPEWLIRYLGVHLAGAERFDRPRAFGPRFNAAAPFRP
jgi:hypothetical protein